MKYYLEVNSTTNAVVSVHAINPITPIDEESDSVFTTNNGCYEIEVDEEIYNKAKDAIVTSESITIRDKNASTFEDMTEDIVLRDFTIEQEIVDMKNYLFATDFYYVRALDSGKPVPEEVKAERDRIRARMVELGL